MSRSLWLALFLFGAVTGARAQQDVAAGDAALAKFDLGSALTAYRAAHTRSPDDYEATWKLARALCDQSIFLKDLNLQKRYCIEAEQLARNAVKLKPDDSKGHAYLAVAVGKLALYEGGKRKVELANQVKKEAERAIKLNDKEDLAYHVLGVWNREMAELNWILRKFAELIYGKFPAASLDDAIHDLQRASQLAPTIIPHRVELGITLISVRRWPEANDTLEKALAMPRAWVTDEYYWDQARQALKRVKPHLN
jgi:Flp pilus assembly protein TadD